MDCTDGARHVHHWLQSIILSKADLQLRSLSSLKVSYVECLFRPGTPLLLSAVSVMDFLWWSLVKERKDDKSQSLMMPVIKAGWFLSFHFVVFALPHTSLLSSHSSLISSHGAVGFHLPQPCCQNKGLELRKIAEKFAILAAYRGRQTARIKGAWNGSSESSPIAI